jgi:hypothetical protein
MRHISKRTEHSRQKGNNEQRQSEFRKAPTYKTLYKFIWKTPNAEIPDNKLPFTKTTSSPCYMNFLGIVFILQKDNETDHLRFKESFRIKTPQELVINNTQLSRNKDTTMNMKQTDHVITCITKIEYFYQRYHTKTLVTLVNH